jgi:hypothetical protein
LKTVSPEKNKIMTSPNTIIAHIRSVSTFAKQFSALPKDARRAAIERIESDTSFTNISEVLASEVEAIKEEKNGE